MRNLVPFAVVGSNTIIEVLSISKSEWWQWLSWKRSNEIFRMQMEEKRGEGVILGARSTLRSDNIAISRHAHSHRFEQDFCKKIYYRHLLCLIWAMYKCLLDNCPHPKSKYHFQALRTLVLAHHMQVAALQSFHLELESILLFCAIIHFT